MTGILYIDGLDVYSLYHVFITESSYRDLIAFPPLKPVDSNDWMEEDGEEFDLSEPVLDTRELSIKFAFCGDENLFSDFFGLFSDRAYHDFNFLDLGKVYRLRLVSQSDMNKSLMLGTFTLRFADDFPLSGYTYVPPQSSLVQKQGYVLDEKDLSEYGLYVLRGSDAEIQKSPAIKKNLLQNIKNQSGAIYDGKTVVFQTKEVKLNCLMRAKTLTEFWRNYNALIFDLIRPKERNLYLDFSIYEYPFYYKNCTVEKFTPIGKIWFQFSLILVFTSFRVDEVGDLLSTEDEEFVTTEQDNYTIDLYYAD